jgi:tetratricopeptide (TPR) repeat protein
MIRAIPLSKAFIVLACLLLTGRSVPLVLVATGFLAAAQSSPPPPSRQGPQEEALRLVAKGQFAEARHVVAGLIEDAKHTDSPPCHQAGLWQLLGAAENRLGRYQEAKTAINQGLQLCDHSQNAAPELTIALLVDLANANLNQGNLEEANQILRRASGIASKDLPPGHPRLGAVQQSLGVLFWIQGQLSRAEKAFRLSLAIFENSLGADHADVAGALSGLAEILTMTARQAEAIPLLERSKTIFERLSGPAHPDTIGATYALGAALFESAPAKAELMLRQAIANWRKSQPERHPNMVKFLSALAVSRQAQGDYREAWILSEQALQMSRDIFGPEHPHVIAQIV